ncbi:c-type cytochrome biogenesis protein CcmI [Thalassotalea aquiviva]|uniref:c-type cytochrome biogenesis protein CcmI n=1 Tax=Thalassotalea aquiviva TaxID=3242415 RepID=UPI00352A5DC5
MTLLWIFIGVLLLVALYIVWRHFFKAQLAQVSQDDTRGQTNKDLYHEHLSELEKDLAEGGIDQESFGYLKEELDRSLLIDMAATEKEQQTSDKKTSSWWPIVISVFIIGFSGLFYANYGAYQELASHNNASTSGHANVNQEDEAQRIISQLQTLHQEVQSNPQNSQAWFQLGRLLNSVGEFNSAYVAFAKVNEIEGVQSEILALQAQARYYQAEQKMTPEVKTLLDQAFAINPHEPSALMLLGMDHYLGKRYSQAADSWQKIVDAGLAGSNQQAILTAIQEARTKAINATLSPEQSATNDAGANVASNATSSPAEQTGNSKPSLNITVSLADHIVDKLSNGEDQTVFIYAINANGPRMPLAAVKVQASDLPINVTLDNSRAMSPQFNLSSAQHVNILAVVSFTGRPGIQPGDFKGELENIETGYAQPLNLVIDTVAQ